MKTDVILSDCGTYRYALWKTWDESLPYAVFIGFTPSAADEAGENPVVEQYVRLAIEWGYGGICLLNMFARLSNGPETAFSVAERIGPENDRRIASIAVDAGIIVGDWGSGGFFHHRSSEIMKMLPDLDFLPQNPTREWLLRSVRQALDRF